MRITLIGLILMLGIAFTSCKDTSKKDNVTMDADTAVLKADTATVHGN